MMRNNATEIQNIITVLRAVICQQIKQIYRNIQPSKNESRRTTQFEHTDH